MDAPSVLSDHSTPAEQNDRSNAGASSPSFGVSNGTKRSTSNKQQRQTFSSSSLNLKHVKRAFQSLVNVKPSLKTRSQSQAEEVLSISPLRQEKSLGTADCPFLRLPWELLQLIALKLPLQYQASLALTSKALNHILGSSSWKLLEDKRRRTNRTEFLDLLERDLCAELWHCPFCSMFHRKANVISGVCGHRRCDASLKRFFGGMDLSLSWSHLYLVKERHLRGGDFGLPIDTLSKDYEISSGTICRFSMRGKIVQDEVIVKACFVTKGFADEGKFSLFICCHLCALNLASGEDVIDKDFLNVLRCRQSHSWSSKKFCPYCAPRLRKCEYCAIEYDFKAFKSALRTWLHFEVWANLGSGQSILDSKWVLPIMNSKELHSHFELGSIRSKYESG